MKHCACFWARAFEYLCAQRRKWYACTTDVFFSGRLTLRCVMLRYATSQCAVACVQLHAYRCVVTKVLLPEYSHVCTYVYVLNMHTRISALTHMYASIGALACADARVPTRVWNQVARLSRMHICVEGTTRTPHAHVRVRMQARAWLMSTYSETSCVVQFMLEMFPHSPRNTSKPLDGTLPENNQRQLSPPVELLPMSSKQEPDGFWEPSSGLSTSARACARACIQHDTHIAWYTIV